MAYDSENIFAKILRGEMPAFTVYENEHCLAFLDVMPQSDGHTLVLPKEPAENLYELSDAAAGRLLVTAKTVSAAIHAAFSPDGIRLMQLNGEAAGQTVFHFHLHIVPCYRQAQARPHGERMAETALLEEHAAKIRAVLN